MSERNYFVICEDKCLFPAMTKEQTLAAIAQAMETGTLPEDLDTGFVTKIREQNKSAELTFWVGTRAEYNAISEPAQNCFYIITDDTSFEDMQAAIEELQGERDITDEVDIAVHYEFGEEEQNPAIEIKNYRFSFTPKTGLVHFVVQCEFKRVSIGENTFYFDQDGYLPAFAPYPVSVAADPVITSGEETEERNPFGSYCNISRIFGRNGIMLSATFYDTHSTGDFFTISGSYFAAAETEGE